jgi:hypothetical protein
MSTSDYSESNGEHSEPIGELEASSTEPERPTVAASHVVGLSLTEAVSLFEVSLSTLRRRVAKGEIAGAVKVPGPKGVEYRIPEESLEALNYQRKTELPPVLIEAKAQLTEERYSERVAELERALERERMVTELLEVENRHMKQNLEDLREALSRIPALPPGEPQSEPTKRRRFFRKNK